MIVVGIRRVDIQNNDTDIHGFKYFCEEELDHVEGVATSSFFASDRLLNGLKKSIQLGTELVPIYPQGSKSLKTIIFLD